MRSGATKMGQHGGNDARGTAVTDTRSPVGEDNESREFTQPPVAVHPNEGIHVADFGESPLPHAALQQRRDFIVRLGSIPLPSQFVVEDDGRDFVRQPEFRYPVTRS